MKKKFQEKSANLWISLLNFMLFRFKNWKNTCFNKRENYLLQNFIFAL